MVVPKSLKFRNSASEVPLVAKSMGRVPGRFFHFPKHRLTKVYQPLGKDLEGAFEEVLNQVLKTFLWGRGP